MSRFQRRVIIGTGGLGRESLWALRAAPEGSIEFAGFVTSTASEHGTKVCDEPVLGDESWLVGRSDVVATCCIGDPRARRALVEALEADGVCFASIIHPSAQMSEHVRIGAGSVIGAGAVLTTQVEIGRHVLVGANSVISHDVTLEDFVTVAPGVTVAGHVTVEYAAELGAGATVIPRRRIGRGALVGAQAAVTADVDANQVVAGVPAHRIRSFPEDRRV